MTKYMAPCHPHLRRAYLGSRQGRSRCVREACCLSGGRRLDNLINQRRMAEMSVHIEAARASLHTVAAMAIRDGPSVLPLLQAGKSSVPRSACASRRS